MSVSRSSLVFLTRLGLRGGAPFTPRPRLDLGALLINRAAYPPERAPQDVLRDLEGVPPPDRGAARPWPNQGGANP